MPCFDLRRSQLMLRCSTKRTDARQSPPSPSGFQRFQAATDLRSHAGWRMVALASCVWGTSLLPQFVVVHGSAGNLLLLGLLFNAMGIAWLICYATAVARGRNVLGRPHVKRALDRISGLVLVGLGTRLALENR